MIWLLLIGFILIILIDLVPLVKRRKWRAVFAFICVFIVAMTLGILEAFEIQAPSSLIAWGNFCRWLGIAYPH